MRRAVLVSAVTLGLAWSGLGPSAAAAQAFQGTIRFTVRDEHGRATDITQFSRPGKSSFMAVESGKPGGGVIVDSTAGTMTIIDNDERQFNAPGVRVPMLSLSRVQAPKASGLPPYPEYHSSLDTPEIVTQERLEAYLAQLHTIASDRPLVMGELGLDSLRHGEQAQARVLEWQVRTAFAAGCW